MAPVAPRKPAERRRLRGGSVAPVAPRKPPERRRLRGGTVAPVAPRKPHERRRLRGGTVAPCLREAEAPLRRRQAVAPRKPPERHRLRGRIVAPALAKPAPACAKPAPARPPKASGRRRAKAGRRAKGGCGKSLCFQGFTPCPATRDRPITPWNQTTFYRAWARLLFLAGQPANWAIAAPRARASEA